VRGEQAGAWRMSRAPGPGDGKKGVEKRELKKRIFERR